MQSIFHVEKKSEVIMKDWDEMMNELYQDSVAYEVRRFEKCIRLAQSLGISHMVSNFIERQARKITCPPEPKDK